jgi:hypothetical protein
MPQCFIIGGTASTKPAAIFIVPAVLALMTYTPSTVVDCAENALAFDGDGT